MRAGIVVDAWKLPIFKRHLDEAGFVFVNNGEITTRVLTLTIETMDLDGLARVLKAAALDATIAGRAN